MKNFYSTKNMERNTKKIALWIFLMSKQASDPLRKIILLVDGWE